MVVSESETDRDSWVRLTLRLPPDLHAQVVAKAGPVSLNSAIVQLLTAALNMQDAATQTQALLDEVQREHEESNRQLQEKIEAYEKGRERSEKTMRVLSEKLLSHIDEVVRVSVREEIEKALRTKK